MCRHTRWLALGFALYTSALVAAPSRVEKLGDDAWQVRDDEGNFGGLSQGITHQRGPAYWAKKILDLSAVPEETWNATTEARLSAYFALRDYSAHDLGKSNGLDEPFEIVINDHVVTVRGDSGIPIYDERRSPAQSFRWHDFRVDLKWLRRGPNEVVFRMAPPPGKKPDDYLYLGIDNSARGGNSSMRPDAKSPWRSDRLNMAGGHGEYMVRLSLLRGTRQWQATWTPGGTRPPASWIDYAGSHGGATRIEWNPARIDRLSPVQVTVQLSDNSPAQLQWLDAKGDPVAPAVASQASQITASVDPQKILPSGLVLNRGQGISKIELRAGKGYQPVPAVVDIAPRMNPPAGRPSNQPPTSVIDAQGATLSNGTLRCRLRLHQGRLTLASLVNHWTDSDMVRTPDASGLWLVEVAGKRYQGSRDFECRRLKAMPDRAGVTGVFEHRPTGLRGELACWIDDELHWSLWLENGADNPLDFKVAFPHLAGLAVSPQAADDYYYFPLGGGAITNQTALIRQGYGDHQALYQVIDLFSPSRGGGLSLRCEDDQGRYKIVALRKHVPGQSEVNADAPRCPAAPDFKWTNPLEAVPGTSMAFEYLRRTRNPGQRFELPAVALAAHAGDWHQPLRSYAAWCKRHWKFRPAPSRLTPVVNMIASGWGQSTLYRDGAYHDVVRPMFDCVELMSWWEWSALAPHRTPIDQFAARFGQAKYERWKSYFVKDPVTGRMMFNNQPGDYDGYNERFGGLESFRAAVARYKASGALVTLYTDPIRCDEDTRLGQAKGKLWAVMNPDGKYADNYDVWNMCHDVADYRQWVANTMRRVLRETGADGIRLDEYGHAGFACANPQHRHTFAEPGCTEWQRAIAETSKLVRAAMDEVNPTSVLTTEHPGYDYLTQFLDGCITYDLTVQASPLRPLECNLQRFLFPECKAYELDHRRADPKHHKRFWNAVGSFGATYPQPMYEVLKQNASVYASDDCQPLASTLISAVYANRFSFGDKVIYHVYNGSGHTIDGPVLRLELQPGEHVFDLLAGCEVTTRPVGSAIVAAVFLPRDGVAAIAQLPRRMEVKRQEKKIIAKIVGPVRDMQVVLYALDGKELVSKSVVRETVEIDLSETAATFAATAGSLRLLRSGQMIDAAEVR